MEELFFIASSTGTSTATMWTAAQTPIIARSSTLGMTEETRTNFSRCFDGEARMIRRPPWRRAGRRAVQRGSYAWPSISGTGGATSRREEAQDGRMSEAFTPDNLFCCEFAPYFYEAIKLRHPEYTDHPRK